MLHMEKTLTRISIWMCFTFLAVMHPITCCGNPWFSHNNNLCHIRVSRIQYIVDISIYAIKCIPSIVKDNKATPALSVPRSPIWFIFSRTLSSIRINSCLVRQRSLHRHALCQVYIILKWFSSTKRHLTRLKIKNQPRRVLILVMVNPKTKTW